MHTVVREQLEAFLERARERDRPVPRFVEREFRAYLECGILAHGFLRLHCGECGQGRLVPFSCKRRGFCPSCGGRRMADTAAHLVDCVLPEVPVRQW
ncbi:MAG: transposase zinc-binding domain-containing protein, partial [Proteobacteria bacterium]|nr:transposase zinc-binding domain-containing protein [Pseudomonadota bacterium]